MPSVFVPYLPPDDLAVLGCYTPLVGSPSSLVPLPTRDNMQAKLDAPLGCSSKGNRCGIGRRRIRAYSLISLYRGLFYSGVYRIGAALIPMGARPRLSPRPFRPRRSGPPFLQGIVTFACRECGYSTKSEQTDFKSRKPT